MAEGVEVHEAADFLARMILSYISSPGHWDLGDPDQVATLVRTELLAGVVGGAWRPAGTLSLEPARRPGGFVDNETT